MTDTTEKADRIAVRDAIVAAMLPHVVFDGWTRRSLVAGTADAGYDESMALRAFPGGLVQAVEHYCDWLDRRMLAELEAQDIMSLRIRDRIAAAVRTRLEMVAPYREAVRRIVAFLSLPGNAPVAAKCTYRAVDSMWYAAGDTATDWNFYTKRGLLAAVYTSTLLYWLADESEESEDTWEFLARRVDDVLKVPKVQAKLTKAIGQIGNPFKVFAAERTPFRRSFGRRFRGGRSPYRFTSGASTR